MRVTGPTVRRRNHAWLEMRSPERRAARLARLQEAEAGSSDNADSSGAESANSANSANASASDSDNRPPKAALTKTTPSARPSATAIARQARRAARLAIRGDDPADVSTDTDGIESAESDDDSADESTSVPANATTSSAAAPTSPAAPPAVTSTTSTSTLAAAPPPTATSSSSKSTASPQPVQPTSSLDRLVTSLTKTSHQTSVASATSTASPTIPVAGSTQSDVDPPGAEADEHRGGVTVGPAPKNHLGAGAVAGIVVGVLAFAALLAAAALLWRKRQRDRGLPFLPQTRFRLRDDESRPPSVTAPLPGRVGGPNPAKTNTQIMDDLMKAAYATEGGANDMEGAFAPKAQNSWPQPQLPAQQDPEMIAAFMDEKAYAALEGPRTPAMPENKPVMRWLDEVRTPVQPNGPEIPPTPEMPRSATMPVLLPGEARAPDPPKQAYFGRDTMTTDTTNTSVRWYG